MIEKQDLGVERYENLLEVYSNFSDETHDIVKKKYKGDFVD